MTQQDLKTKLLSTNYFTDNEYLDLYCELIINNLETKKEKDKTQCHHILPKCYFTSINQPIDNSKENLVNLLYIDHILAHYYLCLCSIEGFKYKLSNALFHLTNRRWNYINFDPKTDLSEYQFIYETYIKSPRPSLYKPVICIETQKIFSSLKATLKEYPGVAGCLNGSQEVSAGYHWAYLDDKERQEKLKGFIGKPKSKQNGTGKSKKHPRIICIDTNETFKLLKDAEKAHPHCDIGGCLRKEQKKLLVD